MARSNFYWMCLGKWWAWEGVVALQSLLTIKKGTNPFNFQSNELFLKLLRLQMAILKFLSDVFLEITRCVCVSVCVGGGGFTFRSLWNSKRALKLLINYPMSPLWSLDDDPFYINLKCTKGITYNPCPEGYGSCCHLQIHNFQTFQLRWTKC